MAKTKLSSVMLTQNDLDALDHIQSSHVGVRSRAAALLFASEMQVRRDRDKDKTRDALYVRNTTAKVLPTCVDYKERGHENGAAADFQRWPFVSRKQVKDNLAAIKSHHHFDAEAEAIRLAIRVQAELDGFTPNEAW